ncbi:hypothetical protein HYW99_02545 [Candidatus Woesearchaeota archaeon]|nr:hypothetical protein [Candidatus Woesearchaeota archaeon]
MSSAAKKAWKTRKSQQTHIDPEWKKFEKFVRDTFIKANFDDIIKKDDFGLGFQMATKLMFLAVLIK